jgi:hypothetical protein
VTDGTAVVTDSTAVATDVTAVTTDGTAVAGSPILLCFAVEIALPLLVSLFPTP